jgi:hypothetical protein
VKFTRLGYRLLDVPTAGSIAACGQRSSQPSNTPPAVTAFPFRQQLQHLVDRFVLSGISKLQSGHQEAINEGQKSWIDVRASNS